MASDISALTSARPSQAFVTDGGLETDLIFHYGVELPHFASFALVERAGGQDLLTRYFDGYAAIARGAGAGLLLEAPTWRANPDWGARLGYDQAGLDRVNQAAMSFLAGLRERYRAGLGPVLISGTIGPRDDAYHPARSLEPDEAAEYHRPQLESFAAAHADLATAYTLNSTGEAIGISRAARAAGLPVAISFTVETDGRLPDGTAVSEAIATVDAAALPEYYLINCAHPSHISRGLGDPGPWRERVAGLLPNASARSHAELDESGDLDEGDIDALAAAYTELAAQFPALAITGGCCGTDTRHVAALCGSR